MINKSDMLQDIERVLVSEEEIHARIKEVGAQIADDYRGKCPILVGVLKGVVPFFAEMANAISIPVQEDFMCITSFEGGTESTGKLTFRKDIDHDISLHNVTYENAQARERTQILMDLANKYNGLVVGTGDLSELALGWATYNGDHMSMYGVNGGIPKTLVRVLVKWVATNGEVDAEASAALLDVLDTPVSPELLPPDENGKINQKTEDLVGPYELHDFFLYQIIRFGYHPAKILFLAEKAFAGEYDRATLLKWLKNFYRRFFIQQFKRSCLPDGPKVGALCLSPRSDWRMPTDAVSRIWMDEVEKL